MSKDRPAGRGRGRSNFNILKTLTLLVHDGLFGRLHNPPNMTWTAESLACDLFTYVYTRETSVNSLVRGSFAEFAQNLIPEKSPGGYKT